MLGEAVTYSGIYEAHTHSEEPDDIAAVATFAENDTGALFASTSPVTSAQVAKV